jgi:hypothetical protein
MSTDTQSRPNVEFGVAIYRLRPRRTRHVDTQTKIDTYFDILPRVTVAPKIQRKRIRKLRQSCIESYFTTTGTNLRSIKNEK